MQDPFDDSVEVPDHSFFDSLENPFLVFANGLPSPKPLILAADISSGDENEATWGIEKYLKSVVDEEAEEESLPSLDNLPVLETKPLPVPEPPPTISLYELMRKIECLEKELGFSPSFSHHLESVGTKNKLRKVEVSTKRRRPQQEKESYEEMLNSLSLADFEKLMEISDSSYKQNCLEGLDSKGIGKENRNCFFKKKTLTVASPQALTPAHSIANTIAETSQQRIQHVPEDGLAYIFDESSRLKQHTYNIVRSKFPDITREAILVKLLFEIRELRTQLHIEATIKMQGILPYQVIEYNKAVRELKRENGGIVPTYQIQKIGARQKAAQTKPRYHGRFVKKLSEQEASLAVEEDYRP